MENDWRTRWEKFKEKAIIGHWIDEDDGHQEEYNTYLSEFDTTKIENFISQELDKAREDGYQDCMDDIWEEAKGLRSWTEHDGSVSSADIEAGLQEAYLNIENKLSQ